MMDKERDRRWSKAVNKKYAGKCPHCNKKAVGGIHHIIPRNELKTRYLITNGIATCNELHRMFEGNQVQRDYAISRYVSWKRFYILESIASGLVANKKFEEVK